MTEPTMAPAGPGALLRAAREKQGLHIAALAAAIKVSPRKLDALENDRWAELPDATFTRALAQTVCRTLKVDPRPILDKLPAASAVVLQTQDSGLNTPFRERPGPEEPGLSLAAVKPMMWVAALLMVAAVAIYLLPADWLQRGPAATLAAPAPAPSASDATVSLAASVPDAANPASAATAAVAASGIAPMFMAEAASAPAANGEPVFASAPPAPTASVAAPPALLPAAPAATATLAASGAGVVKLKATKASWIEVRDAKGSILLSRIVAPGEDVGLDGSLPIRLTIGNAAATQLAFRGQPVDLAPRTRDNVARVELQ